MKLKYIILHCSVSEFGDVDIIRDWHVNGNGWRDIGYNGIILNGYRKSSKKFEQKYDGALQVGRGFNLDNVVDAKEKGAHTRGIGNKEGLGFCLIGNDKFSLEQFKTALLLCAVYIRTVPGIKIVGHNEMGSPKTCPNFSMDRFRLLLTNNHFDDFMIKNEMKDYLKV